MGKKKKGGVFSYKKITRHCPTFFQQEYDGPKANTHVSFIMENFRTTKKICYWDAK
jgi:hypothetical protein